MTKYAFEGTGISSNLTSRQSLRRERSFFKRLKVFYILFKYVTKLQKLSSPTVLILENFYVTCTVTVITHYWEFLLRMWHFLHVVNQLRKQMFLREYCRRTRCANILLNFCVDLSFSFRYFVLYTSSPSPFHY